MKASLSSIVYDLAINGKINEPLSQEMMDCFRKLAGMANNLNQLALEKPRDFDPFGQTGFAHLWLQYD